MNEPELVRACMLRDYAAFDELYRRYAADALRTAYWVTRSRNLAEDAVQETFVAVWRTIPGLREPAAFRGWFYRILVNAALRLVETDRRHQVTPIHLLPVEPQQSPADAPDRRLEQSERVAELREAVAALPDSHRLVVVLRFYNHLSEAEAAEALEIPLGTVKSRLYHARQMMERWLARPGRRRQEGGGAQ